LINFSRSGRRPLPTPSPRCWKTQADYTLGNVVFHIEKLTGPSAVLSAVFLGGAGTAPRPGGSAAFVNSDTTANGNWQSVPFGTEGYNVYGATPDYSSYGTVSYYGDSFGTYTFAASTSDPRGLQSPSSPGSRIAVAKYGASFTLDVIQSPVEDRLVGTTSGTGDCVSHYTNAGIV
jgi:hypothetical protein